MGTWNAQIFGNDTSCEVKEFFFLEYNSGKKTQEINKLIKSKFEYSLNEVDDRNNVLFAWAMCLWETKSLTQDLYNTICKIIEDKNYLEVWKSLDADEKGLKEREKYINKFLVKISTERASAKKRVKPKVQIETDYKTGVCLSFRYPNGNYGGIVIIDSQLFQRSGDLRFTLTNINHKEKPNCQTFLNARFAKFSWETVGGESQKYAAFDNATARINTYSIGYERETKNNFFEYNSKFFEVIGKIPAFTQCLLSTSGGRTLYKEDYLNFEKLMSEYLSYYINDTNKHTNSEKTIEELIKLLVK
jgi:hypothetical protein